MRHRSVARTLVVFGAASALLAGCGSSSSGSSTASGSSSSSPSGSGATGRIVVFAAASLTDTFGQLAKDFEAAHPGTTVTLNFGSSSDLATSITEGAAADVFASASSKTMDQVVAAKRTAGAPTTFATNSMEIAVPPRNPAGVTKLADLAKPGVKLALCQPDVPCGVAAATVFDNAKITVKPVTLEKDVKATLTKVELDEVDAGVVYVTDVQAAGAKVEGITIPADVNATTTYPIALLSDSADPALAKAFIDEVLSPDGTKVLTASGFTGA